MEENAIPRLKKHPGRPDLTGEHPYGDALQVVFILLFLFLWISDSFVWHFSDFPGREVSPFLRIAAGGGVALVAWMLVRNGMKRVFGTHGQKPEVFRDGVFSLVRHPIYSGAVLFYLSLVLFTLSLASLGMWALITLFYVYIARYEERALIRRFGDDYLRYRKQVPMLFPWPSRGQKSS